MRISVLITTLFLAASTGLAAQEEATGDWSTPGTPSSEGASVSIASPEDGETVPTTFTVKFMVSGMGIAPAGSNIDNTGHHHLLIDVDDMPPMNQPLPATDRILHFGGGQTETEITLPPGEHSLQLVFGDYAHRPHDPPVISDRITVNVVSNDQPAMIRDQDQ